MKCIWAFHEIDKALALTRIGDKARMIYSSRGRLSIVANGGACADQE